VHVETVLEEKPHLLTYAGGEEGMLKQPLS
jgi:hypothetical protein